MIHEVSCVRSLNLNLGDHDFSRNQFLNPHDQDGYQQQLGMKSVIKLDQSLPSLTLGLGRDQDTIKFIKQASSSYVSTFSSLSNSTSPKRERDFGDKELEKVFPKEFNDNIDQDELEVGARKKLRLTKEQSFVLEENFKQHSTLNPKQKQTLAKSLLLQTRQVEVWFQNRRARIKLKQNEVDCALLKKYCEALRSDNRRLKMEIQRLKAMKTTAIPQKFYMQFPAATETMCPSCEKIISGNGNGNTTKASKTPFPRAANKSHLFSQLC